MMQTLLYQTFPQADTKEELDEWKKKGARPWGVEEGTERNTPEEVCTPQEYADYLYAELEEKGATAIHIDENRRVFQIVKLASGSRWKE